ncbi:TlpA disulfide reductase family protein [Dechloromonas hortensis]|jgi:peroxiredoxin|uniref:TlpA disulfide reductase family protein n=1 Tax=Dechloromonas hortensis TaxID=337779 RepID=UPI001B88307F|nr:TlpA disulfide reductase family protein [Dechloromonas hortensis]
MGRFRRLGRGLRWALLALALVMPWHVPVQAAPEAPAFTTLDGKKIRPGELRGKLVLVNFWATSCGVCLQEMPDLIATWRRYRSRGFEVIAVAMSYDEPEQIRAYMAKRSLPFPVVFDRDGALAREFEGVRATPTTFLIDRAGKRISKTVGIIDFEKLRAFLESAAASG